VLTCPALFFLRLRILAKKAKSRRDPPARPAPDASPRSRQQRATIDTLPTSKRHLGESDRVADRANSGRRGRGNALAANVASPPCSAAVAPSSSAAAAAPENENRGVCAGAAGAGGGDSVREQEVVAAYFRGEAAVERRCRDGRAITLASRVFFISLFARRRALIPGLEVSNFLAMPLKETLQLLWE
jgi:hypothetical protein